MGPCTDKPGLSSCGAVFASCDGQAIRKNRVGLFFQNLLASWGTLLFVAILLWPVVRRLISPTLMHDDLARLIVLIEHPLKQALFRPCAEHVAVFFDLVSWTTWQVIGHDLRLAPLGFCIASVIPWIIMLTLFGYWLARETGSRTSSLIALAFVSQSPLVLETIWWYSASSFSWAIIGILLALLGASDLVARPRRGLALIALGTMLGPAGSSVGHLAMPLAVLRVMVDLRASIRVRLLAITAALCGVFGYLGIVHAGGIALLTVVKVNNQQAANVPLGLKYAMSVPGRLLVPSSFGLPASWCVQPLPAWLGWLGGLVVLLGLLTLVVLFRRGRSRRTVLIGSAMMYLGYALAYTARAGLVSRGFWTEHQFLLEFGSRYHELPILGLMTVLASILATWKPIRHCDARRGLGSLAAAFTALAMLVIQHDEVDRDGEWLLSQPDQKATMAALHHTKWIARQEGVTRSQLIRLVAPALRSWNMGLMSIPDEFPLMRLVEGPEQVAHSLSDEQVRQCLLRGLSLRERMALGTCSCATAITPSPAAGLQVVSVARPIKLEARHRAGAGTISDRKLAGSDGL